MLRCVLALACSALLWIGSACSDCQGGCGGERPHIIATLLESTGGQVQSDQDNPGQAWGAANPGSNFRAGDSLRTDPNSSAKLSLADGSLLIVQPASVLRFIGDEGGEPHIDLITGEAVVTAGGRELHLHTHVGMAALLPGSSMRLTRKGSAMQLHLEVGTASIRRTAGETLKVAQGETLELEIGKAVIREASRTPPSISEVLRADVAEPGARKRTSSSADWQALPVGQHTLGKGSFLDVPDTGSVTLQRGDDRVRLFGAAQYQIDDGQALVRAQRGALHIRARSRNVEVALPGGWIVARAANGGSEAELSIGERSGQLAVASGEVSWRAGGVERTIPPGSPMRWEHGAAPVKPPTAVIDESEPPAKGHPNLVVRAGESFVVHAPELPVVVELTFAHLCDGDGVIELSKTRRVHGLGRTKVALNADARSYAVRCVGARGTLGTAVARAGARVLRDAGTRELPPRAPRSTVEADGRSYTIHYQNQMPDILVRWPAAPRAAAYELEVDGKPVSLTAPEHEFESGSLRDGTHRLTFAAAGRRSRTTSVEIHFDNTATTASLTAPANRGFAPGDKVEIEGVALPAWKVSVDGGTIEKVGADRFHGQVVTSELNPDIAVRLAHPRLGTHYYLRRAAGSP